MSKALISVLENLYSRTNYGNMEPLTKVQKVGFYHQKQSCNDLIFPISI